MRYRGPVTTGRSHEDTERGVPEVLWAPPPEVRARSRIGRYLAWLEAGRGLRFDTYAELWWWSVDEPGTFWRSVWDHFGVIAHAGPTADLAESRMPGARWFPGATLNYAEQALRLPGRGADDVVIIGRSQTRGATTMTAAQIRKQKFYMEHSS